MIEFLTDHWITWIVGIVGFALGNSIGERVGFNDGLRRAVQIMNADNKRVTRQ